MSYEKDLFISYAHMDNSVLPPDEEGWIDRFHKALKHYLSHCMGSEPKIWRDKKNLQGNDVFDDEICDRVSQAAIVVSVVSPRYTQSEWCKKEVDYSAKVPSRTAGLRSNTKPGSLRLRNIMWKLKSLCTP